MSLVQERKYGNERMNGSPYLRLEKMIFSYFMCKLILCVGTKKKKKEIYIYFMIIISFPHKKIKK